MTVLTLTEPALVKQLAEFAQKQHTNPETLLNQAVHQFLNPAPKSGRRKSVKSEEIVYPPAPPEWLRERAAFERLKPELLEKYRDRVVAIFEERVVAVGDDTMDVYGEVLDKFGYVPCFVDRVREKPRVVRMPSVRVVR